MLRIRGARANNLTGIDLDLPAGELVVFTGVSGSGKSSLAFDTIFREGERRFLGTLSMHMRRLLGRAVRPDVDSIDGVRAAIAIDQRAVTNNPRSTVGTLSEIGDELRLLWARFGARDGDGPPITRALFSFNGEGACPTCRGLGQEELVDPERLVADPKKTLRAGALVPTLPNGYIVYSQVTPEVLDTVCRAHGFDIDTPWRELGEEARRVVFFGSDRVEVPFGKHSLESRMKWTGIKAKPREMGHYRGLVPVIAETLAKKRNANILRFVSSVDCAACGGSRLSDAARAVRVGAIGIDVAFAATVSALPALLGANAPERAEAIVSRIEARAARLATMGLDHLALTRPAATLSSGEARRLRLANQLGTELAGVTYVFDEPSAGAHVLERRALVGLLRALRDRGNSVLVVEHDPEIRAAADRIVEIGPGAGHAGGRLGYVGPVRDQDRAPRSFVPRARREGTGALVVRGASANHLAGMDVRFGLGALNVIAGLSGAGKTSLLMGELVAGARAGRFEGAIERVVVVEQGEIGRSPRSNPATYSGAFDLIRDLFAATDDAAARGFGKGHFSFNKPEGRCPRCEGAGVEMIGLMSLPAVAVKCPACEGRRFAADVLAVKYRDRSIRDVLESTIDEALGLFADEPRVMRHLEAMSTIGLGYLTLGQPAPTLSGGEAQRLQLAKEMAKVSGAGTLIALDEPTTGLGADDVERFVKALDAMIDRGATVVAADHDLGFIAAADRVVELGPGRGAEGGRVIAEGTPESIAANPASRIGRELGATPAVKPAAGRGEEPDAITLRGVRTRNLRSVDVDFPHRAVTVVTGVSGSGKSSLVFDTLAEEGRRRFAESFSPFARRRLAMTARADFESASGMRPTIAVRATVPNSDPRSTVGTFSGVDAPLRLLFARVTARTAGHFSFNDPLGACPACDGRGRMERCDVDALVVDPSKSIADGALAQTRAGRLVFEPEGRPHAVLVTYLAANGIDPTTPWARLDPSARRLIDEGAGDERRTVEWTHAKRRGERTHTFESAWAGVATLMEEAYAQKRDRKVGPAFAEVMRERVCTACDGRRLAEDARTARVGAVTLPELARLELPELKRALALDLSEPAHRAVLATVRAEIEPVLDRLIEVGLAHLTLDRATSSLSTGEHRRLEIAAHLIEGVVDACYVLDEPCLGLHVADRARLASVLARLAARGNAVVVVEHATTVIRSADHIVEIGPGPGAGGGHVVARGAPSVIARGATATGRVLAGERFTPRSVRTTPRPGPRVFGARRHHLRGVDLEVRFAEILAIAGVSGSGKSTLIFDVLAKSLASGRAVGCERIEGAAPMVAVEPRPVGHGPMSTVGTYLDLVAPIAATFAKAHGERASHFLFGSKGRCAVCNGTGEERVPMDFLPDAVRACPACEGTRYEAAVRAMKVDGLTIADVLARPLNELGAWPRLARVVDVASRLGLDHLTASRRTDALSGGESQRLAMTRTLANERAKAPTVFAFDEPSRGLFATDLARLVALFEALAEAGHAVVVVEHEPALLEAADRIVELGPGPGAAGGRVVFEGSPEALAAAPTPTGRILAARRDRSIISGP